jgi:hypothetical protein
MLRLFQNTNVLRLLFLAYFTIIYLIKINMLFVYATVFYFSFELLNAHSRYLAMKYKSAYNAFIVSFVAYILLVRSEILPVSEQAIFHLNTLEHVLFAIIICLHLSIYLCVFRKNPFSPSTQLLIVIIVFNAIGLFNEYFQNYFRGTATLVLEPSNIKDLMANLLGTGIYAAFVVFHKSTRAVFLVKE